ncbi:MAG: TIGR01777 family protein [Candidatus Solibacter sp.]|nr:TIGR01777 family protein [Candidatus Solibacter sp.]
MIVAITGGTGFIGAALVERLKSRGDEVRLLSRSRGPYLWDPLAGPPPPEALDGAEAVVHLAGESVSQYWTAAAKSRIRESRVTGTRNLVEGLRRMHTPPNVLISASAVGFYGDRGDEILDESSAPGTGFLPEVSQAWEAEANAASGLGIRVVTKRTGVVLHPGGGALAKMLLPFKLGLGGRLGSGRQWMPWVHLDDQIGLTLFALDSPSLSGPVNAVAPEPVTNATFVRALGRALRRPAVIPAPAFALKVALGEMSQIVLSSQRVAPRALERAGYEFRYLRLADALAALYL